MPVNLLNEKDLNTYLTNLVYQGQPIPSFNNEDLSNPDFVADHIDDITKAILSQYFKHRLRTYFVKEENQAFLTPVTRSNNLPDWAKVCLDKGNQIFLFNSDLISQELREKITTTKDYLYAITRADLEKKIALSRESQKPLKVRLDTLKTNNELKDFDKAYQIAQQWHHVLAKQKPNLDKIQALKQASLSGTEEVMRLDDNMRIVKLTSPEALDYESELLGHCVGSGAYDRFIQTGLIEIYSLRDENNEPHVTFEVKNHGIYQCKGKANKKPIQKYIPYVQQFINATKLKLVEDVQNTGLIYQNGKYYNIFDLPKGFVIKGDLDLSDMDLTQLPDLSTVIVKGNFNCSHNPLTSLKGSPQKVGGNYDCSHCCLTTLEHTPESINGDFDCSDNQLTSLMHGPKKAHKSYNCQNCGLTSLEGAPEIIGKNFDCSKNSLTSLLKGPKKVSSNYRCAECALTSLNGCPQIIKGTFTCSQNPLTSLLKGPKKVGGSYFCSKCALTSLIGCPQIVQEEFDCSRNENLISLEGAPQKVGSFDCSYCSKITSLNGCPQIVEENFDCSHNDNLISFEGAPQKVNNFDCSYCSKITSLSGCPQIVKENFDCSHNDNLISFEGAPQKVSWFLATHCPKITNLIGSPQFIQVCFDCSNNPNLISFEGAPRTILGDFKAQHCAFESFKHAPQTIGCRLLASSPNLKSLEGFPDVAKDIFVLNLSSHQKTYLDDHPFTRYAKLETNIPDFLKTIKAILEERKAQKEARQKRLFSRQSTFVQNKIIFFINNKKANTFN